MTASARAAPPPAAGPAAQVPGAWPVLGHTPPMFLRPLAFVTSLADHGDVVTLRMGRRRLHALTHPDLVRRVLVAEAHAFERPTAADSGETLVEEGLLTRSGEEHLRQRRMLQPVFHRQRIAVYTGALSEAAEAAAASWRPGRVIAVDREMTRLSVAALSRTLMRFTPGVAAEMDRSVPLFMKNYLLRLLLPAWAARAVPGTRQAHRARCRVRAAVGEAVALHRAGARGDCGDLLSMLLALRDEDGRGLTDRQIQDHLVTFAVAGMETTGTTLAWAFHELGRHHEVRERVCAEVDAVLGGRAPRYEDLARLDCTGRFLTEVLRLYSPWMLPRRAGGTVRLGGTTVEAGTDVLLSPYALHRDPRWFPDPERLDPDRWLPERARDVPKGAFLPFGAGPHRCIGRSFALAAMTTAVAVICRDWHLDPVPGVRVRPVVTVDVHPDRLPMLARRRPRSAPAPHGADAVPPSAPPPGSM